MFRTLKGTNWKKAGFLVSHATPLIDGHIYYYCILDSNTLSWCSVWDWISFELLYLGRAFIRSCMLHAHTLHSCILIYMYTGTYMYSHTHTRTHEHTLISSSYITIPQVPFTTMIALLFLWFGISFPLVLCGFYFGYRKQAYEHPVRTNQIPRQIPEQPWYLNPVLGSIMAGVLPFGAIFVELFFILSVSTE